MVTCAGWGAEACGKKYDLLLIQVIAAHELRANGAGRGLASSDARRSRAPVKRGRVVAAIGSWKPETWTTQILRGPQMAPVGGIPILT